MLTSRTPAFIKIDQSARDAFKIETGRINLQHSQPLNPVGLLADAQACSLANLGTHLRVGGIPRRRGSSEM